MERSEILTAMGGLKLFGMKAAYDEIVATAVKHQHEPQRMSQRDRQELELQVSLGMALNPLKGQAAPETGQAYKEASGVAPVRPDRWRVGAP
jgi:hypothetical protein